MRLNAPLIDLLTHAVLGLVLTLSGVAGLAAEAETPSGMVWIASGTFLMGSELPGSRVNERPVLKVSVDGFWLDEHDVTNAEFRKFVEATGYQTTAERPVDWEELKKQVAPGTPKPPDTGMSHIGFRCAHSAEEKTKPN